MKRMGSIFSSISVLARDFERTDAVELFLQSNGFQQDVECFSDSICRIKESAVTKITETLLKIAYEDQSKEFEESILVALKNELSSIDGGKDLQTFISFKVDHNTNHFRVWVYYRCGLQTEQCLMYSPGIYRGGNEHWPEGYEYLNWITDRRSPIFSEDISDKLVIHLTIKELYKLGISREDLTRLRSSAKKVIKRASSLHSDFPDSQIKAYRQVVTSILKLSNLTQPQIEINRYHRIVDKLSEYQINISVTGKNADPFTYALGMRGLYVRESFVPKEYAAAMKSGGEKKPWNNLFSETFAKDEIAPDLLMLRYGLQTFKYRTPTRKTEKILSKIIPFFYGYSFNLRESGKIVVRRSKKIVLAQEKFRTPVNTKNYGLKLNRLFEFCRRKRIEVAGHVEIEGRADTILDNKTLLPYWDITNDGVTSGFISANTEDIQLRLSIDLELILTTKSNLKYIAAISDIANGLFAAEAA